MEPSGNKFYPHHVLHELAKMKQIDEKQGKLPQLYINEGTIELRTEAKAKSLFSLPIVWTAQPGLSTLPFLLEKTITLLNSELQSESAQISEVIIELDLAYQGLDHINKFKNLDTGTQAIIRQALNDIKALKTSINEKSDQRNQKSMIEKIGFALFDLDPLSAAKLSGDKEWANHFKELVYKNGSDSEIEKFVELTAVKLARVKIAKENELMLTKLFDALSKIGDEVAEDVLNDEELINRLTQFNSRVITDQDIKLTLEQAKERPVKIKNETAAKKQESGIDLEKLENRLAVDLPANIEVIKQAFPEIAALLKVLPSDDSRLRDMDLLIKKAMVLQAIKRPQLQENEHMLSVFNAMSLDNARLSQNQTEFNENLKKILDQDKFKELPFNELEEAIWHQQLLLRFTQAGGKEEEKQLLLPLYQFQKELKISRQREILESVQNAIENDPEIQNFPVFKNSIKLDLPPAVEKRVQTQTNAITKTTYNLLKKEIADNPKLDIDQFLTDLNFKWKNRYAEANKSKIEDFKNLCKNKFAWYREWGKNLQKELIQGSEDTQEIFQEGVCHALCLRLNVMEQKNPGITIGELADNVVIKPTDRYTQAYYGIARNNASRGNDDLLKKYSEVQFPKSLLIKTGIKEAETLFLMEANEFDLEWLDNPEITESLKKAKYTLMLGIAGHALFMCLDDQRKIYHFFDPNVGLTKNFDSRETMLNCFNSLLKSFYPDNNQLKATALYL